MADTVNLFQVKKDLGEDVAKMLQNQYPSTYIYSSNDPYALEFESIKARDLYIFRLYTNAGKSYSEIADMVGLGKDRVSKIVARQIKKK